MALKTPNIAVIGGSGFTDISGAECVRELQVHNTPFGKTSSPLYWMKYSDLPPETPEFLFLLRHGIGHTIPPHQINEMANLFALMQMHVDIVLNFTAMGAISEKTKFQVGDLAAVSRILDLTGPRTGKTFFRDGWVGHYPTEKIFCPNIQAIFVQACRDLDFRFYKHQTCATIEGPHYFNKAELKRTSGCDLIGMTQSPFFKLAVESNICFLIIAIVTDDVTENNTVTGELVEKRMKENAQRLAKLLKRMISSKGMTDLATKSPSGCQTCVNGPESIVTDRQYWSNFHQDLFDLMFRRWKK